MTVPSPGGAAGEREAHDRIQALIAEHHLSFTHNPGGGEVYRSDGTWRCQLGMQDYVADLATLVAALPSLHWPAPSERGTAKERERAVMALGEVRAAKLDAIPFNPPWADLSQERRQYLAENYDFSATDVAYLSAAPVPSPAAAPEAADAE